MRKTITFVLFLGVLLTFSLTSCKKDGNDNLLWGRWKIVAVTATEGYWDLTEDLLDYWTFKEEGDCRVSIEGYYMNGKYEMNEDSLTIIYVNPAGRELVWKLNIDVLDKKEMQLSGTLFDYNGSTYDVTYKFERQKE